MPLKVLLANAPNPTANGNASNYACYPHIGIIQLATAIRDAFRDQVEVCVVDGGISNTVEVQKKVRDFGPDLVGVSALTPTYSEALKIADTAKRIGAKVVLGDDHAGFFPELILVNRPAIDYIVANDVGETPFVELVGALLSGTPLTASPRSSTVRVKRSSPTRRPDTRSPSATRFRIWHSYATDSTCTPGTTGSSSDICMTTRSYPSP